MNNTMQLYIDEEKQVKGYPLTSPDRVIDEKGVSIAKRLKNNVKYDVIGQGIGVPGIDGKYDDTELKKQINTINEQLDNIVHIDLRQFPKLFNETDDTERIQRAINHINSTINSDYFDNGYGVLHLPPGTFDVKTLILKSNVHIKGSGMGITRLNPIGTEGYVFDTVGTSQTVKMSQCEIRDLTISPVPRAVNSNIVDMGGINLEFTERIIISNVRITNISGIGVRNVENYDSIFENIEMMYVGTDEQTPALLLDGTNNDSTNALHVIANRIEQCPFLLKITSGSRSNQFIGCKFEGGRILIEECNSNVFEACDFVTITKENPIIKIGTTRNDIRGLKFNGCSFLASGIHQALGIEGDASAISITLMNCNFTGIKKAIYGNGLFNLIGCEFMDCLSPVIELERGRINSCILSYVSGTSEAIKIKGNVICRDCHITSNGSTANGISVASDAIIKDNMLSYLKTGIICTGSNNLIKGNAISNVSNEFNISDKSLNKIYDRFGDKIN